LATAPAAVGRRRMQADAALIICDGHSMLIDGGNKSDSSLIYSYLKKLNVTELDYIVCTHPHEDHVGGLAGALNYAIAKTALCPVTNYDSDGFRNFVKYLGNQNVEITVPNAGDVYGLGCAEVMILGPIIKSSGNDNSIVLRIEYGQTSFLFTGDAEREEEQDILNAGYSLCSTVLKVGHHGSDSSTCYEFLYNIMPQYAVISVGEDNAYGHPSEDVLSRLRDADVSVYRTDLQGDIICVSDGLSVDFTVERNANIDTLAAVGANSIQRGMPSEDERSTDTTVSYDYVLNTNTKKFHYPSCASVNQMKDKNKQFFSGTRDELIANGYSPCGNCNP